MNRGIVINEEVSRLNKLLSSPLARLAIISAALIALYVSVGVLANLMNLAAPAHASAQSGKAGSGIAGGPAGPAVLASPTWSTDWTIESSPNMGTSDYLNAIAAVSSDDVWAVGEYVNAGGVHQTLVVHWDGTTWSIVPSPNQGSGDNALEGVAVVASNDVWAVGEYINAGGVQQTLVERWDGTTWSITPSPNQGSDGNALYAIACDRNHHIWVVGSYTANGLQEPLTARWDDPVWTIMPSPAGTGGGILRGISASQLVTDVWAVGSYRPAGLSSQQTLVEHWDGSALRLVPSPNQGAFDNSLDAVDAVGASDDNIFAVGDYQPTSDPNQQQTLIEHWNGTRWIILQSPNPGQTYNALRSVVTLPPEDPGGGYNVWAVGEYQNPSNVAQTLVERLDIFAFGVEPSDNHPAFDNSLKGIAAVSTSDVWAVGSYGMVLSNVRQTLIERYNPCAQCPTTTPVPQPTATSCVQCPTATPTATACLISFEDVPPPPAPGSTFYPYIRCLACRGVVSGYPCGGEGEPCNSNNDRYFEPTHNMTRGQISKIVSNAMGYSDPAPRQVFQDVPEGSPFFAYAWSLHIRDIVNGYPCGTQVNEPCVPSSWLPYFRPNGWVSRQELAKIISQAGGFLDMPPGPSYQWPRQYEDIDPDPFIDPLNNFYLYIYRVTLHGLVAGYACGIPSRRCIPPDNLPYFEGRRPVTRGQAAKMVANLAFPDCQTPEAVKR